MTMEWLSISTMNYNILIDIFVIFSILSAWAVIRVNNPMYSILYLIFLFVNIAIYLYFIGIAIMSLLYLLVYVGAIAILFLFILSLLNVNLVELNVKELTNKNLPLILILFYSFYKFIYYLIDHNIKYLNVHTLFPNEYIGWYKQDKFNNILNLDIYNIYYTNWYQIFNFNELASIGNLLYTEYAILFIILAIILLLSIIGAITVVSSNNK